MSAVHSVYQVMPPLTEEEFDSLKADIALRGILVPSLERGYSLRGFCVSGPAWALISPAMAKDHAKVVVSNAKEEAGTIKDVLITCISDVLRAGLRKLDMPEFLFRQPGIEWVITTDADKTLSFNSKNVYFIINDVAAAIKIGVSDNPISRLVNLQTASPYPLRLLGSMPGGRDLESRLHKRFARHRISGEWFTATPELLNYISEVAQ